MGKIEKQKVYDFLLTIPYGKVATYGTIAKYLGNKNLARTVGNILHDNPDQNKYPCYKIVSSKGNLAENYAFGGAKAQRKHLESEGVTVKDNKVDLKIYGFKI